MSRRDFIGLVSSAAIAWSLPARAQPATPVIGFLNSGSASSFAHLVDAFRAGLKEAGFVEGQNIAIEYRWAENKRDRLPELVADLVGRRVGVIAATGGSAPALAAKAATSTIPIVFTGGGDPVRLGLVASLSKPGGNATGVINISGELTAKRLEILRDLIPKTGVVGVLQDPNSSNADMVLRELQKAAGSMGQQVFIVKTASEDDFDAAFERVREQRAGALLVLSNPIFTTGRERLVALAARHAIPAIYAFREFPVAGGLISYGASITDGYRQAGVYTGKILKGAKPHELPVLQPTKFELVINLMTAKALGIVVPATLLARADEVIE